MGSFLDSRLFFADDWDFDRDLATQPNRRLVLAGLLDRLG